MKFRAAQAFLSMSPLGARADEEHAEVRRLLLPTVRYVVFYRVDNAAREVQILALWHASRETPDP
jgi:plasmid stabilization system protein ParE